MRGLIAFLLALLVSAGAWAAPSFPALTGRVVDNAHLLSPEETESLTRQLEDLEQRTTIQLVVVTLPSLQGYDIADYGYQLGRTWGIGQKGADNGVLLIVAPSERKVRIEVGYGLEGQLTDAVSSIIIQSRVLPSFKKGNFAEGIRHGVNALADVISGEENVNFTAERSPQPPAITQLTPYQILVVGALVLIFLYFRAIYFILEPRPRAWLLGLGFVGLIAFAERVKRNIEKVNANRNDFGGWGGGGGISGGGFGGFSGGGGSFGGGGASGSW